MSLLDDVKQRLDVVQLISQYVDLDTSARTPKALCPFHTERTPSFVVFPDSQTWRCFGGCATGGDALSFIMKRENLSFGEALRSAAARLGIREVRDNAAAADAGLHDVNEIAASYFLSLLKGPDGKAARDYLAQRGLTMEAAERRGLGLSPSGIETLAGHLQARRASAMAARAAGLVTRSRDDSWRDMFRGRLTVQIRDRHGKLIGFGARSLDGSDPKYLNTSRSELFDKSRVLYGLNWAEKAIREQGEAVIVEGYMDAITAHEHGFTNVVACMGTAITRDQLAVLSGMAKTVILALDADAAGQEATVNALDSAWQSFGVGAPGRTGRMELKVASPTGGKDPDEAIRSDPDGWRGALAAAVDFLTFRLDGLAGRYDLNSPEGKARATEEMFPLLAAMDNPYEQDRHLARLAGLLGVTVERLRADAGSLVSRRARRRARDPESPSPGALLAGSTENALEEHLLSLVLRWPDLREYALATSAEHFVDSANRAIFTVWQTVHTMEQLLATLDGELAERVARLRARPLPPADQPELIAAVTQCVQRLHERHLRNLKREEERLFSNLEVEAGSASDRAIELRPLETNARLKQLFTGRS